MLTRYRMIANRMMKGCNGKILKNNIAAEESIIQDFEDQHHNVIQYLLNTMPPKMSVGILSALGKAILWYGEEKIKPLCERIANKDFRGINDPVYNLYDWLIKRSGRGRCKTEDVYRVTVTVIRACLRNGQFTPSGYHIRPAVADIFEWDEDYKIMINKAKNNHEFKTICDTELEKYLDICTSRNLD